MEAPVNARMVKVNYKKILSYFDNLLINLQSFDGLRMQKKMLRN